MYEEIIKLLVRSNLGSFIKEDIVNNHLIRKDEDISYYKSIKRILLSNKSGFEKERAIFEYLTSM